MLDEAQNIKNAATKAAQAARALPARWRVALTGTPVENRLTELWSIFQFLNPGYLGSAEAFRKRFAIPIERANDAERDASASSGWWRRSSCAGSRPTGRSSGTCPRSRR